MPTSEQIQKQITDSLRNRRENRKRQYEDLRTERGIQDREANLDEIRGSVADTQRQLSALPRNVRQRAAGRLMTQAQRDRILSKESQNVGRTLGDLSQQENTAAIGLDRLMGEVNELMRQGDEDFNRRYGDLTAQRGAAWQREAEARQAELQREIQRRQEAARVAEINRQAALERAAEERRNRLYQQMYGGASANSMSLNPMDDLTYRDKATGELRDMSFNPSTGVYQSWEGNMKAPINSMNMAKYGRNPLERTLLKAGANVGNALNINWAQQPKWLQDFGRSIFNF